MFSSIEALKNAIAYAKFDSDDIRQATVNHLESLDAGLTEAGFEEGTDLELTTANLQIALDSEDEEDEGEKVKDEDENDPFAGLGEDDEEEEV